MPWLKNSHGVREIPETYSYSKYTTYLKKTYKAISITKLGFLNKKISQSNLTTVTEELLVHTLYSQIIYNINKANLKLQQSKMTNKKHGTIQPQDSALI